MVVFEVRVPERVLTSAAGGGGGGADGGDGKGCDWKPVVCVTGSDPALGSWDVRSSIPLQRNADGVELWTSCDIPLPADSAVWYSYLILLRPLSASPSPSQGGGEDRSGELPASKIPICLRWWECFRREVIFWGVARREEEEEGKKGDVFGERGGPSPPSPSLSVPAVRKGWLVDECEIQIQLTPSTNPEQDALYLHTPPAPPTTCSLLVQATSLPGGVATRVLDGDEGTCVEVEQGEKGVVLGSGHGRKIVVFSARVPFSTKSPSFQNTEFSFKVLAQAGAEDEAELVGVASFLPRQFLSHDLTHGTASLDVLSPCNEGLIIGKINLSYLLVTPVHPEQSVPSLYSLERCPADMCRYWCAAGRTLDGGHRGLGNSYKKNPEENPSVTENTVLSLSQAGKLGADFVEFDVQLTRDLVPILYHDFRVDVFPTGTEGVASKPKSPLNDASCTVSADSGAIEGSFTDGPGLGGMVNRPHRALVKDLLLEQLHSLRLEHSDADEAPEMGVESLTNLQRREEVDIGDGKLQAGDLFPTLEEVLECVPEGVGFNVEVKYPVPEHGNDNYNFPYFDRNKIADRILHVLCQHVRERKIVLSCFDADMCTVLHLKQSQFPVVFLTINSNPEEEIPLDIRNHGLLDAIAHATSQGFMGINIDSYRLLDDPDHKCVELVQRRHGLALFTYGKRNNSRESLERQRRMGVNAVMYDRVDKMKAGAES